MVNSENNQTFFPVEKEEESNSSSRRTDKLREIACSIEEYDYEDERLL